MLFGAAAEGKYCNWYVVPTRLAPTSITPFSQNTKTVSCLLSYSQYAPSTDKSITTPYSSQPASQTATGVTPKASKPRPANGVAAKSKITSGSKSVWLPTHSYDFVVSSSVEVVVVVRV